MQPNPKARKDVTTVSQVSAPLVSVQFIVIHTHPFSINICLAFVKTYIFKMKF